MDVDVTWGNGRGCPLVVHYWVDMQSVHRLHCYDSIHVCKLIALYTANAYSAKREMSVSACSRDVNETLAYETETRPRHLVFGPRRDRDQDLPAIPRDETETSDFCHETRPRPCKAKTETFFETFNVQPKQ